MNDESGSTKLPFLDKMFNWFERKQSSDRLLLKIGALIVFAAVLWFVIDLNNKETTTTPGVGGTLTEGIVGTPRFINPVLSLTRADRDVTALVYSGLMRLSPQGEIVPHLAEEVAVSEDGIT